MTRRSVSRLLRDPLRTLAFALPAVMVAVFLPLLVRAGLRTVANSKQGRVETSATARSGTSRIVTTLPPTPAALLVAEDASGVPVTMAVMAVAPGGRGGTLLVLPTGMIGVSGQRLDASFATGGLIELAAQVEQTLLVTLAARGEAKPDVLGSLLAPLTPVSVTFDDAVRGVTTTGEGVVRPAGAATLDGPGAAAVLTAHGAEESELARLPRTQQLWGALLAGRHDGGTLTPPSVGPSGPAVTSVLDALGALAASTTTVVTVAVEPRGPTGAGEELMPDLGALRALVARVLPGAVSPLDGNLRLRIVNPSGDPAVSLAATRALVAVGANIVMIDDKKGAVPARSSLQLSDATRAPEVEPYKAALGALEIQTGAATVDGLDATVTLGADLAPAAPGTVATPAPTTTTA